MVPGRSTEAPRVDIYSPKALHRLLKEREVYPYCHLSDSSLKAVGEALRLFDLRAGDRLTLMGDGEWHYLSLLSGLAEIEAEGTRPMRLDAETTRQRPYPVRPRIAALTVTAHRKTLLLYGDSASMDVILSWDELIKDFKGSPGEAPREIVEAVRRSAAFRRLPMECVEEACRRMHRQEVPPGAEVVRQGQPNDCFYVIRRGWSEVWQTGLWDEQPQAAGEMHAGESFGEDTLVSGGTSGATVRFPDGGEVLVLPKDDFLALVSLPMIREVDASVAKAMVEQGHVLLDVRYEEEMEEGMLPGAVALPLYRLRQDWRNLDADKPYIAYCRSGKRSAVAALLLSQRGLNVVSLKGGIIEAQ